MSKEHQNCPFYADCEKRKKAESKVYLFEDDADRYKIGRSKDPPTRRKSVAGGYGKTSRTKIIMTFPGGSREEKELQNEFAHLHIEGEWFKKDPTILQAYVNRGAAPPEDFEAVAEDPKEEGRRVEAMTSLLGTWPTGERGAVNEGEFISFDPELVRERLHGIQGGKLLSSRATKTKAGLIRMIEDLCRSPGFDYAFSNEKGTVTFTTKKEWGETVLVPVVKNRVRNGCY